MEKSWFHILIELVFCFRLDFSRMHKKKVHLNWRNLDRILLIFYYWHVYKYLPELNVSLNTSLICQPSTMPSLKPFTTQTLLLKNADIWVKFSTHNATDARRAEISMNNSNAACLFSIIRLPLVKFALKFCFQQLTIVLLLERTTIFKQLTLKKIYKLQIEKHVWVVESLYVWIKIFLKGA